MNILGEIDEFLEKWSSVFFEFNSRIENVSFGNCETAHIVKGDDGKYFMEVNESFWGSLTYDEKCFLFTHEVMHVLLDHFVRGEEFFKRLPIGDQNRQWLNIAMDIALHEVMFGVFFDENSDLPFIRNSFCFVETIFIPRGIIPERNKSFEYYYRLILENANVVESSLGESEIIETGEVVDVSGIFKEIPEDIRKKIETPNEEIEERSRGGYSLDEGGLDNGGIVIRERDRKKIDIEKKINYMMRKSVKGYVNQKFNTRWDSNDRKFLEFGDALPRYEPRETLKKHKIVVFCDVSGSVSKYVKPFVTTIDSLNKEKYDLEIYVFASYVKKATMKNGKLTHPYAGPGTNFDRVHKVIKGLDSRVVDGVFVLTDGFYENYRGKTPPIKVPFGFFYTKKHAKNSYVGSHEIVLDF